MQPSPVLSLSSPSFNGYSSANLAEIAARVVQEFRDETRCEFDDMFGFQDEEKVVKDEGREEEEKQLREEEEADDSGVEDEDDDDFEFPSLCGEPTSPISADEIFCNGQIRPVFPVFDRSLLFADIGDGNSKVNHSKPPAPRTIRLPLRKLMNEDRDPPSCSSSEADELDGVPAETYCAWTPKAAAAESPGRCRKSNSTGSSKRWKFRDLLYRSNSDGGKDTFVFLSSSSNANSKKKDEKATEKAKTLTEKSSFGSKANGKMKPKVVGGEVVPVTESYDTIHATNQRPPPPATTKDGERRRSFLPYRQDLVGMFANVNGISRNLPTF